MVASPASTTRSDDRSTPASIHLLRKYAIAGPRYTSYPPATHFRTPAAELDLAAALAADNDAGDRPLSLYLHLPFCESRCWYCGCTTVITRDRGAADLYLDDLAREIALYRDRLDPKREVVQLHLGGGTPTFLTPTQLDRLAALLHDAFRVAADAEVSAELDPRRLTREHVAALRRLGARRASLGVQDTDHDVQLAINRIQPHALNEQAVAWLRADGFTSINVDLIYGLPRQTPASFSRTIDDVLGLAPDRLSVFSYAHVPWLKPSQKIFEQRGELPDTEQKLVLWAVAREKLTAAGFVDIGLDHFARPDDELVRARRDGTLHRNFQGYSTRAGASLYAFGMSSISATPEIYFQNFKDLGAYRTALAAGRLPVEHGYRPTADDLVRRRVIMKVMCERRLDFAALSQALRCDFAATFAGELASLGDLEDDGIVERTSTGVRVTGIGLPLLRVVAMRFDAYVGKSAGRHSRVI